MDALYPRYIISGEGSHEEAQRTQDGIEVNSGLMLHKSTLGTGSETYTVDADQNGVLCGPVTINCTLTVLGTLTIV